MIFTLMLLAVVGYSTSLYGTGLDTGHNHLMLEDQEDFWSVMFRARVPPQDERINEGTYERTNERTNDKTNEGTNERTNERINEGTKERINEGTNEMTNERGIIRLLKRYDKIYQEYFSMLQEM